MNIYPSNQMTKPDCIADLRARLAAAEAENERLREVCESFVEAAEAAVRHHRRDKGGQQVPFHGDFASVMPSTVGQLDRWARSFRAALDAIRARRKDG